MKLYIDPGTGSMLFAILLGIFGTVFYLFKAWLVKLRFLASGGKKVEPQEDRFPIVIFSEGKRYWHVFAPVCRELDRRGAKAAYMTASADDPALRESFENIRCEFIGEGNRAFARMNFLKANIVLSTTPGLDVYQWKRSKNAGFYVHILHGPNEIAGYRMFGIDYYDGILLSGEYQARDVRALEKKRNLPEKELVMIGIPYMDEMKKRLEAAEPLAAHPRTALLAPTWGPSSIFQKFGGDIIRRLIDSGYHVIVRPHPQSFVSEKDLMDRLMQEYPESEFCEWNRDPDNFDVLRRADILVSDFSGVVFEFALVHDKPVIYADTEFDNSPYDAWWLDTPFWTMTALPRIGTKLTKDDLPNIGAMMDDCIQNPKYARGRDAVRSETWAHIGEGAVRAADYLMRKNAEITAKE